MHPGSHLPDTSKNLCPNRDFSTWNLGHDWSLSIDFDMIMDEFLRPAQVMEYELFELSIKEIQTIECLFVRP